MTSVPQTIPTAFSPASGPPHPQPITHSISKGSFLMVPTSPVLPLTPCSEPLGDSPSPLHTRALSQPRPAQHTWSFLGLSGSLSRPPLQFCPLQSPPLSPSWQDMLTCGSNPTSPPSAPLPPHPALSHGVAWSRAQPPQHPSIWAFGAGDSVVWWAVLGTVGAEQPPWLPPTGHGQCPLSS